MTCNVNVPKLKNTNDINDIEDIIKTEPGKYMNINFTDLFTNLIDYVKKKENDYYHKNKDYTYQNLIALMKNDFQKEIRNQQRIYKVQLKKTVLLYNYRKLIELNKIEENELLILLLMKKPSNNISGINQITILTSPTPDGQDFSCKHDCYYCPNEPAHEGNNWTPQPRSYLTLEPAVQRANRNGFDPYLQTKNRLDSLLVCGHKCDKLEFIIEGGTFTEYPKKYLKWFFQRFIYCVNTYFDNELKREMKTLEEEIIINETGKCKIIGICIETRPDAVLENDSDGIPWVTTLLCWGVTRIQLGLQHIDNKILRKINRGHSVEKAIKAIEILKNNCFKIDIHIMPDLPYSSQEKDMLMFDELFSSQKYQPDQMKIYPCEVVPWTKIKEWYEEGKYKPYGTNKKDMEKVLTHAMQNCPPWIRLPRVIRDIPDNYISAGVKCGNMRQVINDKLKMNDTISKDIRYREIGRHPEYSINDAVLFIRKYDASNGIEYFISYETKDEKAIFGFIRLRIIDNINKSNISYKNTLDNMGLIRELHVYGNVETLRNNTNNSTQHVGFGRKLLKTAEILSLVNGKKGVVVISGIGVRKYYKKFNYYYENNYMIKIFNIFNIIVNYIMYFMLIINSNIMFYEYQYQLNNE